MGAFLLYLNVIIIIEKAFSSEVITMLKRLRNTLLALTALLGITALFANTVQAAYDTPYLKGQVVLKLNWNSYVYDRYGNRMPWFNGLYGPLGYLKKGSYVYTTRKRLNGPTKMFAIISSMAQKFIPMKLTKILAALQENQRPLFLLHWPWSLH